MKNEDVQFSMFNRPELAVRFSQTHGSHGRDAWGNFVHAVCDRSTVLDGSLRSAQSDFSWTGSHLLHGYLANFHCRVGGLVDERRLPTVGHGRT